MTSILTLLGHEDDQKDCDDETHGETDCQTQDLLVPRIAQIETFFFDGEFHIGVKRDVLMLGRGWVLS